MTHYPRTAGKDVCPMCSNAGKAVKPVTIECLVKETAKPRIAAEPGGFLFCATPTCDTVYFRPSTGEQYSRTEVRVPVWQKEKKPTTRVCYCFNHTIGDVESEVAETGASTIYDAIAKKCRQGLDRCEDENPQGSCCLGNVRRVLKDAQAKLGRSTLVTAGTALESIEIEKDTCAITSQDKSQTVSRINMGVITQFGALVSAIVASACCWLLLLLLSVGVSGGALSATFEAWRPVLLPVTFVLLAAAFYFTYRRPRSTAGAGDVTATEAGACCSVPPEDYAASDCCLPEGTKGFTLKKLNKVMLWVVTVVVLSFAFFPHYAGYLLGGANTLKTREDLANVVVEIDGMTCEACAATLEDALRKIPGVVAAEVDYKKRQAVVGLPKGSRPPKQAILSTIAGAGNYQGRFAD